MEYVSNDCAVLRQIIIEAVENCTDANLLDLIYKLLIA